MKKKFTVRFNWYATADVEVLAESEDDAIKLAKQVELDPSDYNYDLNESSVIGTEDVPDLDKTIKQAEAIIKKSDNKNLYFSLDPKPWVRIKLWDGIDYYTQKQSVESISFDKRYDEISFMLEGRGEICLSELPELQQLEICQSIINQAASNGVKL